MKLSEDVKAFYREMANYRYYINRARELALKIEYAYDSLGGSPRSIKYGEISHGSMSKDTEYQIRDDITHYETNRRLVIDKIAYLDTIYCRLEETSKKAIDMLYRGKVRHTWYQTADRLGYSRAGLQYVVNTDIKEKLRDMD